MNIQENYVNPYDLLYEKDLENCIEKLFKFEWLTEREETLIKQYYLSPKTSYASLARKFNISHTRVSQVIEKGVRKLRKATYDLPDIYEFKLHDHSVPKEEKPFAPEFTKIKILPQDPVDVKIGKYFLMYPRLLKFGWRTLDQYNPLEYGKYIKTAYLVFLPKRDNILYKVENIMEFADEIYKWAYYGHWQKRNPAFASQFVH